MNSPSRTINVRRLGYYLIGVALGCVLLGLYFQGRQAYVARQRAAAAQLEAERAAGRPGIAPPAPGVPPK